MLSRVADALFWMSRYLERAEQTARLLDVCFHLELDLHGVSSGPHELHWTSLAAILQQQVPAARLESSTPQAALSEWLTFDTANPNSIMSCVTRARLNARSIRGTINSAMWRELNKLYWQLSDAEFQARARESPHEFNQAVECGSCLFHGVCDATCNHDEGWQFVQLGKFLDRADKTLRILDVQYHVLHELSDPDDRPLTNLQWAAVLRSCLSSDAYQRLHVGRIEPERVVEFLLMRPDSPRSVRFCLEASAQALRAIEGAPPDGRGLGLPDRVLGLMLADLAYRDLDEILESGLHPFLGTLLARCAEVGRAVQDRYSLL
jgi:uncharacterized alpha-E superfamily protein